jgi:hypothetical protein
MVLRFSGLPPMEFHDRSSVCRPEFSRSPAAMARVPSRRNLFHDSDICVMDLFAACGAVKYTGTAGSQHRDGGDTSRR